MFLCVKIYVLAILKCSSFKIVLTEQSKTWELYRLRIACMPSLEAQKYGTEHPPAWSGFKTGYLDGTIGIADIHNV